MTRLGQFFRSLRPCFVWAPEHGEPLCGSDHDPDGWVVALLPGEVRARLGGESGFVQLRGAGGRGRHRTPITRPITRPMFGSSEELAVAAAVPVVGALDVLNDVTAEGPDDCPALLIRVA